MESTNAEVPNNAVENNPPQEIHHVPVWVKGIVVAGLALFLIQLPSFGSSLTDAIQKKQAANNFREGQYTQAIAGYSALRTRYPKDKVLTKQLGLSQYRAGQYIEAIDTFNQLAGVKMPKHDVEEINAVIADIATKLNLKPN
jgi:Flp pilus assembly protein TadD